MPIVIRRTANPSNCRANPALDGLGVREAFGSRLQSSQKQPLATGCNGSTSDPVRWLSGFGADSPVSVPIMPMQFSTPAARLLAVAGASPLLSEAY